MKTTIVAMIFSGFIAGLHAQEAVELNAAKISLGKLSQPTNAAANQNIMVKRTAQTPRKVTVEYEVAFVAPGCSDYELQITEVPELKQTNCLPNLDQTHTCEEVTVDGYQIPKRVCVQEGLVLGTQKKTFELDFRKAVTLMPAAAEIFQINMTQEKMNSTKMVLKATNVDTDSVYKVKSKNDKIVFKAD